MLIDFHTHIFPDNIAVKALPRLQQYSGGICPCGEATVSSQLKVMARQGVDKAVLLSIATNPKQQRNVNDFAISLLNDERLIPFGSVHPDSEDALTELERLKSFGIKGVKLHPDYQGFFADEERMIPIYKKIAELGLITVFHAGVDIGFPEPVHCTPSMLKRILPLFGDTPVVAAHLGGYLLYEDVVKQLCGTDIYLDTSFSYGTVPPMYAKRIIEKHGADRVLFGTDMPWSSPENELSFIDSLQLEENEKQKILYKNAVSLLKL